MDPRSAVLRAPREMETPTLDHVHNPASAHPAHRSEAPQCCL